MLRAFFGLATISVLLLGCSSSSPRIAVASAPTPTPSALAPLAPSGEPVVLATGLAAPWSIVRLGAKDSTLISERDSGKVLERLPSGVVREIGTVPGVAADGEGGLLGLAVHHRNATGPARWLYAYFTAANDNRIVRMPLEGSPGSYRLGAVTTILTGMAKARNHDGGRIAFGPDAMLYATVGDAGQPDRAQNLASLNGKILRMTAEGAVPKDNPFPGSLVYSLGHRNPQGIAWDSAGQLWSSEFGQNTWDEFNRIVPGGNYGWPLVEGIGSKAGLIDPVYQCKTSEASPSGLAYVGGTFFLAALRGERLWSIFPSAQTRAVPFLVGRFGRLRDAVPGPEGTLWILTSNTDGYGTPGKGPDRLLEVRLASSG